MKVPKLEKLYKVIWEYYYNCRRKHQKTFEYVKRDVMIDWVAELRKIPVTSKISVFDYDGHCKEFVLSSSDELMKQRMQWLKRVDDVFGDEADKFMRSLGDSRKQDLPLGIQANLDYLADKRLLERYVKILDGGEAVNPSLYVVAGVPLFKVMRYYSEIRNGERSGVPADFKLTEYQCRLLRGVGLWTPELLKREEEKLL